jgi:hypothetical protein
VSHTKRTASVLIAALAGLSCFTASAAAGVATYSSTATFGVPNNTGQSGLPSQVFVPPGRTAIQSVELTAVKPSFGGGGGLDLQLRLEDPAGTEIDLLDNSACNTWPNTSAFTISDSAPIAMNNNAAFCTALAGAPTTTSGRPADPLTPFNGKSATGVWTVTVVDIGLSGSSGSWNGWSLRVTHAPPTLAAKAAKQKLAKNLLLTATSDANGTLSLGGDAKRRTEKVAAGDPDLVAFKLKPKAIKKIRAAGKGVAKVAVTLTDDTGGTAVKTIKVKVSA